MKIPCECGSKGELEDTGKKTILTEAAGGAPGAPVYHNVKILSCNWCGRQALFRMLTEEDEYYEL